MALPVTRKALIDQLEIEYQRAFNGTSPRTAADWTLVRVACLSTLLRIWNSKNHI